VAASQIKQALPDAPTDVAEAIDRIHLNSKDQMERARVAQADHAYKPKELPPLRSPEDTEKVQQYAGRAQARDIRRRFMKNLPKKIATGMASVVKRVIPGWLWWGAGAYAFVTLGGMALLGRAWRGARSGLRGMIQAANDPEVKDHFRGRTNGSAQKEYRRMKARGALQ
jgi:hypothetical protein